MCQINFFELLGIKNENSSTVIVFFNWSIFNVVPRCHVQVSQVWGEWEMDNRTHSLPPSVLLVKDVLAVAVRRAGFWLGILEPYWIHPIQYLPCINEKEEARRLTRSESLAGAQLGSNHWTNTRDDSLSHVMFPTLEALEVQLGTESNGLSILVLVVNGALAFAQDNGTGCRGDHRWSLQEEILGLTLAECWESSVEEEKEEASS